MNLNDRMAKLEERTEEMNKTLWRIHSAIYGNGTPGLKADIHAMKTVRGNIAWIVSTLIALAAVAVAIIK